MTANPAHFDAAKPWIILSPFLKGAPDSLAGAAPGITAESPPEARDLARCIAALRKRAGLFGSLPPIVDAEGAAPPPETPVILLNKGLTRQEGPGFSWRAAPERVEIYGESRHGMANGVYDFLEALGFAWPAPGKETLPPCPPDAAAQARYPLAAASAYKPSPLPGSGADTIALRRRMVWTREKPFKSPDEVIDWAARTRMDAIVLPFRDLAPGPGQTSRLRAILMRRAARRRLLIEEGGWELPYLLPRRLFLFHKDLFRMEDGRRRKDGCFCPTHPETLRRVRQEAGRCFQAAGGAIPDDAVFHVWPARSGSAVWCSCPTCRAFSPREQNRIACNAAADALLALNPKARLSYYEEPDGEEVIYEHETMRIAPRENLFPISPLPFSPFMLHSTR
ncbi:MAG: hypothetical protein LBR16_04175 [Treponema sp.]|jgi:hypothetical protein|nr:hypothetical protein [Treponema sp.]